MSTKNNPWLAFSILCIGQLMIILDATVTNVALPSIKTSLGFSQASLSWVVNAYILTFGGFLLLAGRLGDLVGRKTMFLAGTVLFTLASLLCGLANSQMFLIIARASQGVGGAIIASVVLSMIYSLFSEEAEQAKAMSIYSAVSAAGGSIGLIAGGLLTQLLNWHWIFLVNVPIGIVLFITGYMKLEKQKGLGFKEGIDVLGAVLITSASMVLVYTIIQTNENGWTSMRTLSLAVLGVILLGLFILVESRIRNPLVPLRIFRHRNLVGASIILSLFVAGLYGWFFMSALYFGSVLGYNSLQTGLAFLPASLLISYFSVGVVNKVIDRFGEKNTLIAGLISSAASLVLCIGIPLHANFVFHLLPSMILFGIGVGISFAPLMTMGMSEASQGDSGLASGILNTAQQIGAALGLSILATFAASKTKQMLASGVADKQALLDGYHLAFLVSTVFLIIALVIALKVMRTRKGSKKQIIPIH